MLKQQGPPKGPQRPQTFVLRVNIHCDGCRKKVKKLVQKINGVQNVSIDAELGKVIVMGYIDPRIVIKKLTKSGKHAELWRAQERSFHGQNHLNHQFKNMQIEYSNSNGGERERNFQKGGGVGFGHNQPKGSKDMMQMVPAAKKSVTFDLDEDDEDYASDDSFCNSDDGFELDLGPRTPRKPSAKGGGGVYAQTGTKGMKKAKKGGLFRIPMLGKSQGQKNEGKYSKGGKNDKYGGKNGKNNSNGGNPKQIGPTNRGINRNNGSGGDGGRKNDWMNGTRNADSGFDMDFANPGKGRGGAGRGGGGGGGRGAPVRQIANYPMGHQGQIGNFPAVEGLPAPMAMQGSGYGPMAGPGNAYNQQHPMARMQGSGYGPTAGPGNAYNQQHPMAMMQGSGYGPMEGPGNAYNQQQPMAMMMMRNQQRAHGNEVMRPMPMMYGMPHPMMNYPHHPMPLATTARGYSDPYTHMFSDENTESCSIM